MNILPMPAAAGLLCDGGINCELVRPGVPRGAAEASAGSDDISCPPGPQQQTCTVPLHGPHTICAHCQKVQLLLATARAEKQTDERQYGAQSSSENL